VIGPAYGLKVSQTDKAPDFLGALLMNLSPQALKALLNVRVLKAVLTVNLLQLVIVIYEEVANKQYIDD
jgi:hypothetical protein